MSKVILFPSDTGGCGLYRMSFPAQAVRNNRPELPIQVAAVTSVFQSRGRVVTDDRFAPRRGGRRAGGQRRERFEVVKAVKFPPDVSTIVLQRVTSEDMAGSVRHWVADGLRVVIDIDDDLSAIHPTNPAFQAFNPRGNPRDNWNHLRTACRDATLVTCTTEALARRYAPHGRVEIIPNSVPAGALAVRRRERPDGSPLVVGWTGTAATHGGDLEATGGGVAMALRDVDRPAKFRVVGNGEQVADRLGLDSTEATGWLDMPTYYDQYGQLDVAIVPLGDGAFNTAKSDLKGLEACAVGTPFAASATDPYRALTAAGVGVLVRKNRPRDWRTAVKRLLVDDALRAELAQAGREYAAGRTFDVTWKRWAEVWEG